MAVNSRERCSRVALIVEGHYDTQAAAVLVNRWFRHRRFENFRVDEARNVVRAQGAADLKVLPSLTAEERPDRGVERYLRLVRAMQPQPSFILIMLDADDECEIRKKEGRVSLGVELKTRAQTYCPDIPVDVIVIDREFESWFLARSSLMALRHQDLIATHQPLKDVAAQALRRDDHKQELARLRTGHRGYSPSVDQAELARYVPFTRAMRWHSPSFHKLLQKLERLTQAARQRRKRIL